MTWWRTFTCNNNKHHVNDSKRLRKHTTPIEHICHKMIIHSRNHRLNAIPLSQNNMLVVTPSFTFGAKVSHPHACHMWPLTSNRVGRSRLCFNGSKVGGKYKQRPRVKIAHNVSVYQDIVIMSSTTYARIIHNAVESYHQHTCAHMWSP